jgi:septal ring factor EnvC (AmiA/AmiB activator)
MSIRHYESEEAMDEDFEARMVAIQEEQRLRDDISDVEERIASLRDQLKEAEDELKELEDELETRKMG